ASGLVSWPIWYTSPMKTIAIYHKDCSDGTTAAAVVLKKYPGALLFPMRYGYSPDEMAEIVKKARPGDNIFTVDCVMGAREFLAAGFPVVSIDHHEGIKEDCEKLAREDKKFTYVFNNKKSGSSLAWSHFFPGEEMPELVKYVEDFDLWNWKYGEDTKKIGNAILMLMNKPEETLALFDKPLDEIKREGAIITKYSDFMLRDSINNVEPLELKVGDKSVHIYNITQNKSEAGNILSSERKSVVGLFTIHGKDVRISFRSKDDQMP